MNHVGMYENINVARRSEIYILDRVDVCWEYFEIKSYDIENDNFPIILVYNKKQWQEWNVFQLQMHDGGNYFLYGFYQIISA